MLKYSYELSESYRNQTFQPKPYFLPPRAGQRPTEGNKKIGMPQREHAKTFFSKENNDALKNMEYKRQQNETQLNLKLAVNQSMLKAKEAEEMLHLWKPNNNAASLENRLKILTHLGERHEQAIKQLNASTYRKDQSPIKAIQPNMPQANTLKRQFSFNHISSSMDNQGYPLKKSYYKANFQAASPAPSKQDLNHTERMSQMGRSVDRRHRQVRQSPRADSTRAKHKIVPNQTVAKLSSLQERIKSTMKLSLQK